MDDVKEFSEQDTHKLIESAAESITPRVGEALQTAANKVGPDNAIAIVTTALLSILSATAATYAMNDDGRFVEFRDKMLDTKLLKRKVLKDRMQAQKFNAIMKEAFKDLKKAITESKDDGVFEINLDDKDLVVGDDDDDPDKKRTIN